MTMRLTQGQARHIKRLWAFHNKMEEALANLTLAIASDSETGIETAHNRVLEMTIEIENEVEHCYPRMIHSTPGPKKAAKKGARAK